ncbi:hypothetical protein A3H78_01315 [Candidatus Roizmanbacteria bacterium RIFCSPLOWO2_02_FULL_36_11]|uniref:Serine protease n=1 Tax=Candidatus Roizmanbacteria bacterium RIFCSPLOWO2_02_FULL_36_11 TaxID=1802071 RepID=A0A1F7JFA2_9BACT|nr:MAG: hypothetical protein A3H78_01315 [Candidatus Roizmanbacteria bacterium RIFCSPLOWO2_02_FULL_36_11]
MSELLSRREFLGKVRNFAVGVAVAPAVAALDRVVPRFSEAPVKPSVNPDYLTALKRKALPDSMPSYVADPETVDRMVRSTVIVTSNLEPYETSKDQYPATGVVIGRDRMVTHIDPLSKLYRSHYAESFEMREDGTWTVILQPPDEDAHFLVGHPQYKWIPGKVTNYDKPSELLTAKLDVSDGGFDVSPLATESLQAGEAVMALSYNPQKHATEGADAILKVGMVYLGDYEVDGSVRNVFAVGLGRDAKELHAAMAYPERPRDPQVVDEQKTPSVLEPYGSVGSPVFNQRGGVSGLVTEVVSPAGQWFDHWTCLRNIDILNQLGYETPTDKYQLPDLVLASPASSIAAVPPFQYTSE